MELVVKILNWIASDIFILFAYKYIILIIAMPIIILLILPFVRFERAKEASFKVSDDRYHSLIENATLKRPRIFILIGLLSLLYLYTAINDFGFICGMISTFLLIISGVALYICRKYIAIRSIPTLFVGVAICLISIYLFYLIKITPHSFSLKFSYSSFTFPILLSLFSSSFGLRVVNVTGEANANVYTERLIKRFKGALEFPSSSISIAVGPVLTVKSENQKFPPILSLLRYKNFRMYMFKKRLKSHYLCSNKGSFGVEEEHTPCQLERKSINSDGDLIASTIYLIKFNTLIAFGLVLNKLRIQSKYSCERITINNFMQKIKYTTVDKLKKVCNQEETESGKKVLTYNIKQLNDIYKKYDKYLDKIGENSLKYF